MPSATLFSLLDDITGLLDDVWIMSKLSAQKTAGVLGDDLAVNAEQAIGLKPERELPVIFAVARGSAKNKAMLIPLALLLRAFAPGLVHPLLMCGGAFLCFEGAEKLYHKVRPPEHAHEEGGSEEQRISGAVRTDLILSAEILAVTLGVVAEKSLGTVALTLIVISIVMTIGVYGFVALIVKLDDIGLALQKQPQTWKQTLGRLLLAGAPRMMAALSWLGTLAIFCVGGGILAEGIGPIHHLTEKLATPLALLAEGAVGLAAGALILGVVQLVRSKKGSA